MDFAIPMDHRVKKRKQNIDKNLDLAREQKTVKHKGDSDTICSWCTWNSPQKFGKEILGIGSQRKNQDHPHHSIKICKNTEKSPRDLRRLAVSQT